MTVQTRQNPHHTMMTVRKRNPAENRWHLFHAVSDEPIQPNEAMAEQQAMGFDPAGYGFEAFRTGPRDDGRYLASWKCYTSCD